MGTLPARCGCAADERRTSSAQKRARALLRPPHASGPGERCWVRSGRGADVAEGERNRNQRVFPCSINTLVPSFKLLGAALKFLLQCHDRALAFLELLLEIFQLHWSHHTRYQHRVSAGRGQREAYLQMLVLYADVGVSQRFLCSLKARSEILVRPVLQQHYLFQLSDLRGVKTVLFQFLLPGIPSSDQDIAAQQRHEQCHENTDRPTEQDKERARDRAVGPASVRSPAGSAVAAISGPRFALPWTAVPPGHTDS
eukprot:925782-Rhodomonas_salina.2